jgi:hypothetical protein
MSHPEDRRSFQAGFGGGGGTDRVGDIEHLAHFPDIVNSHNVSAVPGAQCDGRGSAECPLVNREASHVADERLP